MAVFSPEQLTERLSSERYEIRSPAEVRPGFSVSMFDLDVFVNPMERSLASHFFSGQQVHLTIQDCVCSGQLLVSFYFYKVNFQVFHK